MTNAEPGLVPLWLRHFPPAHWLREYRASWLGCDIVAGMTLAAYAVPVALAYAELAGLPPQVGVYGYMLGGLGYALLGSSRQLAIGPTSAISLMVAGTVGAMADGDMLRYAQITSLAAFTVAILCLIAWMLRLSVLVRLISDSILVGFKAGAGLTIIMSQLPSLIGVAGGGHNFFERAVLLASQLGQSQGVVLALGIAAIVLLLLGDYFLPQRPIALAVVTLSIFAATAFQLASMGVPTIGEMPAGLPILNGPALRLRDVEGIVPLAAGCLLLAYIEGISAARTFAAKHALNVDPRQEFLGLGAANLAAALGQGYPVAGGLSQSAVNDKAGARTPLALVFASITLALCLLFLTNLLENLPKAVLAAIVLAALASILMLLARASTPHVAFLGRVPRTEIFSDRARHPENEMLPGVIAFRPEASLLYVNTDFVLEAVLHELNARGTSNIRLTVCDLSASPHIDMAGSRMLHQLHDKLAQHDIALRVVSARGRVRDLLRADGIAEKVGGLDRFATLESLLCGLGQTNIETFPPNACHE
jgi:SulP family sulfate permease